MFVSSMFSQRHISLQVVRSQINFMFHDKRKFPEFSCYIKLTKYQQFFVSPQKIENETHTKKSI